MQSHIIKKRYVLVLQWLGIRRWVCWHVTLLHYWRGVARDFTFYKLEKITTCSIRISVCCWFADLFWQINSLNSSPPNIIQEELYLSRVLVVSGSDCVAVRVIDCSFPSFLSMRGTDSISRPNKHTHTPMQKLLRNMLRVGVGCRGISSLWHSSFN